MDGEEVLGSRSRNSVCKIRGARLQIRVVDTFCMIFRSQDIFANLLFC